MKRKIIKKTKLFLSLYKKISRFVCIKSIVKSKMIKKRKPNVYLLRESNQTKTIFHSHERNEKKIKQQKTFLHLLFLL